MNTADPHSKMASGDSSVLFADGGKLLPEALSKKPFRYYMQLQAKVFSLGVTSLFFTNFFDVLNPLALKLAIDHMTSKNEAGLFQSILIYGALMAGVTLFRYLWRIYFGRFHHKVAEDLRNRIFAKFTELGPSFFQKKPVGELMALITNDVNTFRMAIGPGVLILIDAIFLIIMILPLMFWMSVSWTWMTLILLPVLPFFMAKMEHLIHDRFRVQQDRMAEMSASAQEIVSGVRVIKSYAQENNQRSIFNRHSRKFEEACNSVSKVDSTFEPLMEFGVATGSVILLYFCSDDVTRGAMSIGTFVAFHEYIKKMIWPMSAIGMGISMVEQGRVSFERIRETLATPTDTPDTGQVKINEFKSLEVRDLTFSYPQAKEPTLKNISFHIQAGETIGLVGAVGAGKTTLVQLLCRLWPAPRNSISINETCIQDLKLSSLRGLISLVPQDPFLFSDSISENVSLGLRSTASPSEVELVTKMVNIDREIDDFPEKYNSHIGERGVNLSGGQKQRLTIARALILRAPLVILDDSLSAVDGQTEKTIVSELKATLRDRSSRRQTTILVSHRLATLKHADRIIVLNGGTIEAIGTHDELLESSATYLHLSHLQSEQKLEMALIPPRGVDA